MAFFHEHYPHKAADGRTDYTPSCANEIYYGTDSAELLVGMKSLLPRLLALGESHGWDKATLALWRQMYADLPELPRGSIQIDGRLKVDEPGTARVDSGDLPAHSAWYQSLHAISLVPSDLLAPVRHQSPQPLPRLLRTARRPNCTRSGRVN